MSITSYAQNFEDVMLWRVLGHIPNGFYIDAGAQHPVVDSVTKAFYEQGWRGVHIEASEYYATLVRADRPDEMVLQAALSDKAGLLTFYEIPDTGLSTGDAAIAEHHRAAGFNVVETVANCITLADVFAQIGQRDIHWLKIDVEGMEAQVVAGWGNSPARPWVLVVESTYPNSQVETHQAWEGMLLAYGYIHVYFDGLSRYYVLACKYDLGQKFNTPPNIFDGFSMAVTAPYNALARNLMQQEDQKHQKQLADERTHATNELQTVRETFAQKEEVLGKHISQLQHQIITEFEQRNVFMAARDTQAAQTIESLCRQHTDHERLITQQLQNSQEERIRLHQEQHAAQKQVKQEIAGLLQKQTEQEHALLRKHNEREETLNNHIATLQSETKVFHQAKQSQLEQYNLEAKGKLEQHNLLLETCAALRTKLHDETQTAQQTIAHLRKLLKEAQHSLELTHASLSWQMTAPLRKLVWLFHLNKNQTLASISFGKPVKHEVDMEIATGRPPMTANQASIEPLMPSIRQTTSPLMPTIASTLAKLTACHDQQFILFAYQTLLGRAPDSEGVDYYIGRLRTGISKIQILAQIRLSKEGKAYKANVQGLDAAIRQYQRQQKPLIGWLFRIFFDNKENYPIDQKLRSIENLIYMVSNESHVHFNKLETALDSLHNLVMQQTQTIAVSLKTSDNNNLDNPLSTANSRPEPDGLQHLSPSARDVYFELKKSAETYATRVN